MPSFSAASLEMRCIFAFWAMSMSDGMMVSVMVFVLMGRNIGTHARCSLDAGQELPKRCDQPFRCYRGTMVRGREPVRAQSAISYKNNSKSSLLFTITVFLVRMRFSSVPKTRLARASAQWPGADLGTRRRIHRAAALELARTATGPRGKHGWRARARKSVGGCRQRLAAAETGMHRHRPALLHFHRAVFELGDLAERIEHRVGELVRRRFVIAERNEHRAPGGAGIGTRVKRYRAAARSHRHHLARLHAEAVEVEWME